MFVGQAPFGAQMLPVGRRQGQGGQHGGKGAVNFLLTGPLRLWDLLFRSGRIGCRIFRGGGSGLQSLADLLIGRLVADSIDLCVQGQHSAALAAVVAAPDIFAQIEIHLSAAVATDRAVHIDIARPPPPDIQAEKGGHVHNRKGEIHRTDNDQLLSVTSGTQPDLIRLLSAPVLPAALWRQPLRCYLSWRTDTLHQGGVLFIHGTFSLHKINRRRLCFFLHLHLFFNWHVSILPRRTDRTGVSAPGDRARCAPPGAYCAGRCCSFQSPYTAPFCVPPELPDFWPG